MCGIIGYVGQRNATPFLLEGLTRLEYRGYDSSGVATLSPLNRRTQVRRAVGAVDHLREVLAHAPADGTIGLAHTRWATHGAPKVDNAHPHHVGGITVVHNGIIENADELKFTFQRGVFRSDTDTEVIAHVIAHHRRSGLSLLNALAVSIRQLEGSFALGVLDAASPSTLAFARRGSPLVIGVGDDCVSIASDAPALGNSVHSIIHLADGDYGLLSRTGEISIFDVDGNAVERPAIAAVHTEEDASLGRHRHAMRKEIGEQGRVIDDTIRAALGEGGNHLDLRGLNIDACPTVRRVQFLACGSSFYAASVGAQMMEQLAGIPADAHLASEWRYGHALVDDGTLVIGVSQSGETADTLAALEEAKRRGAHVGSVCNVADAAIPRCCAGDVGTFLTRAGVERGVASTKAFTAQVVALQAIALALACRAEKVSPAEAARALQEQRLLASTLLTLEENEREIRALAESIKGARTMLYLGRGLCAPIAHEGALKMTEISYVHAQGFAAGEMKHGPIALIERGTPVVVLAPRGPLQAKVLSNLAEVKARGAFVIAVGEEGDTELARLADAVLSVAAGSSMAVALAMAVPLQLLAYHVADLRGLNVDRPRNLAKSVTVE